MKILIDITPTFSKWVKNEKEFIQLFKDTLRNELGKADLDGELNSVRHLKKVN